MTTTDHARARRSRRRPGLALTAMTALVAMLAAISSASVTAPAGAATANASVADISFSPSTITITAGDTVTWTQTGFLAHSVTANDLSFDSSPSCPPTCLSHNSVYSHTFPTAGSYAYHCRIHGAAMSGTVVVQAAGTSYATGYTAEEAARVQQTATWFNQTPAQIQKTSVLLIEYLLLISNPRPAPSAATPPVITGPTTVTTTWADSELPALQDVMAQFSLTAPQTQKFGAILLSYLLALNGH